MARDKVGEPPQTDEHRVTRAHHRGHVHTIGVRSCVIAFHPFHFPLIARLTVE